MAPAVRATSAKLLPTRRPSAAGKRPTGEACGAAAVDRRYTTRGWSGQRPPEPRVAPAVQVDGQLIEARALVVGERCTTRELVATSEVHLVMDLRGAHALRGLDGERERLLGDGPRDVAGGALVARHEHAVGAGAVGADPVHGLSVGARGDVAREVAHRLGHRAGAEPGLRARPSGTPTKMGTPARAPPQAR